MFACALCMLNTTYSKEENLNHFQEEECDTPISTKLISEVDSIKPGIPFYAAIEVKHREGWHTYWKNPGDVGIPTSIDWQLPEGFTISEIKWPVPSTFDTEGVKGFGYQKSILLLAEIIPPKEIHSDSVTIKAKVSWLACSTESCMPGSEDLETTLRLKEADPVPSAHKGMIDSAKSHLPKEGISVLSAKRTPESIEILLSTPHKNYLMNAEFLSSLETPSTKGPSITQVQKNGNICVILKNQNDPKTDSPTKKIEGLLLLGDSKKDEGSLIAYEVSHLLDEDDDDLPLSETYQLEPIESENSLLLFLGMAFLGGMILNLMPCVLPVVSLKILNFVQMAGKNRRMTLTHGMSYSLGVLVSFWALAGALIMLQAYGSSVGWGFQLQEPLFVAVLCTVLLIFSLSMFGVFEVGTIVQAIAGKKEAASLKKANSQTGSFLSGVLATAVATPCTGPFLGPAIGFAVTQSPLISLLMFTSLGAGMAFPYLLLSAFPGLLRFLPKPGNWMIIFKEGVAFIMLATVLWLLWVFGAETSTASLFLLIVALFFLSFSCWVWGKFGSLHRKRRTRLIASIAVLLIMAGSGKLMFVAATNENIHEESLTSSKTANKEALAKDWVPFSKELLDSLIADGKPVFIDFTARWCLICQTNHMALSTAQVDKKFNEQGVVKMKADWTRRDPSITKELQKFGRSGVPLYLYFDGKKSKPEILPQILTPEVVVDYLQEPPK